MSGNQETAFIPSRYREIYVDFDISRFDPVRGSPAVWNLVANWRKLMNAAVPGPVQKANAAKRP